MSNKHWQQPEQPPQQQSEDDAQHHERSSHHTKLWSLPRYRQPASRVTEHGHSPYTVESPNNYRPGGLHPLHIDDIVIGIADSYRIVDKLGFDSNFLELRWIVEDLRCGKVWKLAINTANYTRECATRRKRILGILMKECEKGDHDGSNPVSLWDIPHDVFEVQGPNGQHLCVVTAFYYTTMDFLHDPEQWGLCTGVASCKQDPGMKLARLIVELTVAVKRLHDKGIVHGAINRHSVAFTDDPRCSDSVARYHLGLDDERIPIESRKELIKRVDGRPLSKEDFTHIPRYLLHHPQNQTFNYDPTDENPHALLTAFDASYLASDGPYSEKDFLVYVLSEPQDCAPEVHLGEVPTFASDIWSLGLSFYTILTSQFLNQHRIIYDTPISERMEWLCYLTGEQPFRKMREAIDRDRLNIIEHRNWTSLFTMHSPGEPEEVDWDYSSYSDDSDHSDDEDGDAEQKKGTITGEGKAVAAMT
ncbi:hypothetical protein BJ508DRAFT_306291 [Ascobolus immersus RN42]|uniref:Protein kinase domain-containing protein n=1 Tax=Ascobolus immersus RN42 TaxID=1160509 RepID=A0A3N4I867_ASCIM|nr:hypothetical protein BJ508DRAFT_306291 [Ascobolus immersus RN42]